MQLRGGECRRKRRPLLQVEKESRQHALEARRIVGLQGFRAHPHFQIVPVGVHELEGDRRRANQHQPVHALGMRGRVVHGEQTSGRVAEHGPALQLQVRA